MTRLQSLGWSAPFEAAFHALQDPSLTPARIVTEHRDSYRLAAETGDLTATLAGRLRHHAGGRQDLPAVGDWVAAEVRAAEGRATVRHVLPRRSALVRKTAGRRTTAQIVAANVDHVFLVTSLNQDFNPGRLERFVSMIWESGAQPVLVLSKADLAPETENWVARAKSAVTGVPVHATSGLTGDGVEVLLSYLTPGRTGALIGSSGVGKSTLVNRLVGSEILTVHAVRGDDDKGRHTTTHRELVPLPSGGNLVDTPGMRELALWDADDGVDRTFEDVESLAAACRFSDCSHVTEPGCAILAALESGALAPARLESHRRLKRELAYTERKRSQSARIEDKRRMKALNRVYEAAKQKRIRERGGEGM